MNERKRNAEQLIEGIISFPGYPFSGREIVADLAKKVARELGVNLTVRRLSKMWDVPPGTLYYWQGEYAQRQVLALVLLIERLDDQERLGFLRKYCRVFPRLRHPRLDLSSGDLARLLRLLDVRSGLTVIRGGSAFSRGFLLTAIAHSVAAMNPRQRNVIGIDLRRPSDFVPAETIKYINPAIGMKKIAAAVDRVWPHILTAKASLVLLNGVWSALPQLHGEIMRVARFKHLILTDATLLSRDQPGSVAPRVLTISQSKNDPSKITVSCSG